MGNPRSNYAYGMGFASGSAGPLDKFKMTVGEGGIRVPLLIAGPGVAEGKRIDSFVYVTDIMPTLLELTGAKYPSNFDGRKIEPMSGRSMTALLKGSNDPLYSAKEYVGGEMGGGKWMRQGDLKAVLLPKPYGTGNWQLFDLREDPGEAKDLAAIMPDKLNDLMTAWNQYAEKVGVVAP